MTISRNLADEEICNAIAAVKLSTTKLATLLSRYDEIHFDITEERMENIAALVSYLKLYAARDDSQPVAIMYAEHGKLRTLALCIAQELMGTANHTLVCNKIAEFATNSNAVFKTARKAKICCNCVYGHKEPHCPYAGEITMYYTCEHWKLWHC